MGGLSAVNTGGAEVGLIVYGMVFAVDLKNAVVSVGVNTALKLC